MVGGLRVLVVCTANICRSPVTAALLAHELGARWADGSSVDLITVASAGTEAAAGLPACGLTTALVATYPQRRGRDGVLEYADHASQPVTVEEVRASDLVVCLDRSHRAHLARLVPSSRSKTFTLRQAAAIASAVASGLLRGRLPEGAPPLPTEPVERLRWLVAELDAGRGLPPAADGNSAGDGEERSGGEELEWHRDDIPDPHVVGYQVHPMAVELIEGSVTDLTEAVDTVLAAPITAA